MRFSTSRATLALASLMTFTLQSGAIAQTDSGAMKPSAVPCDQAASMMMGHGMMSHGDAMKGDAMAKGDAMKGEAMKGDAMKGDAMKAPDVDHAFASMAAAQTKMMIDMAKLEMRCGKDKKVKDAAENTLDVLQKLQSTLTLF